MTSEVNHGTDGSDAGLSAESVVWARASVSAGSTLISGNDSWRWRGCEREYDCLACEERAESSNVVGSLRRETPVGRPPGVYLSFPFMKCVPGLRCREHPGRHLL